MLSLAAYVPVFSTIAIRGELVKKWMAAMLLAGPLTGLILPTTAHAADYLAPEAAFKFSAGMVDAKTLEIHYAIADGYYMYRDRFHFVAEGATLGPADFPHGSVKDDENFQKEVETCRHRVSIRIPIEATDRFTLKSTAQGCADQGLCYPPMESVAHILPEAIIKSIDADGAATDGKTDVAAGSDMHRVTTVLKSGKLPAVLPLFFLLGIGLSLTPCVLPMVPILSSIIVGTSGQSSRGRGLLLSMNYVLGMTLVYTALGITAGMIGEGLSAQLQHPWMLGLFALLMTGLSLSMFGFYQLQIPPAWQSRLAQASRQSDGKLLGVFLMGMISALIVGPCVAAPLASVLLYIGQTHDVVLGGSALFAMALGMGSPLLVIGASAGVLLPRAGNGIMDSVAGDSSVAVRCRLGCFGYRLWCLPAVAHVGALDCARLRSGIYSIGITATAQCRHWWPRCPGAAVTVAWQQSRRSYRAYQFHTCQIDCRAGRCIGSERRQACHARFLCRLVRLLQRDGKTHLHRCACA